MYLIQPILYFSLAILVFGTALKVFKISRMPMHLRWDLYPIPHEKGKKHYGGSYYEETDWWTKPRNVSLASEITEVSKEILVIQSLYRNNKGMWFFSFPFHIGLYFITIFSALLFFRSTSRVIYLATSIVGATGLILGALGALGLLLSRIFKGELRRFSTRSDYFNLLLLLALFSSGLFAWLSLDNYFLALGGFVQKFITFRPAGNLPMPVAVQLYIIAAFFAYLPFTHMTHFAGKYFTYHKVRWQDKPNLKGNKTEMAILKSLGNVQNWSAPHMQAGKTWADAASEAEEDPKEDRK